MSQDGRILKQITDLQTLTHRELQERWRTLYGTEPPSYNRPYLVKRLAYRIQEISYASLSELARAQLRDHARREGLDAETRDGAGMRRCGRKNGMPVPGTRLVREWQGRRYEVMNLAGEGCWRWSDPYRTTLRIHTTDIGADA